MNFKYRAAYAGSFFKNFSKSKLSFKMFSQKINPGKTMLLNLSNSYCMSRVLFLKNNPHFKVQSQLAIEEGSFSFSEITSENQHMSNLALGDEATLYNESILSLNGISTLNKKETLWNTVNQIGLKAI